MQTVDTQVSMAILRVMSSGDLTTEAAMRLLFPEDAAMVYDAGKRWPQSNERYNPATGSFR
jgi:hypothetical protein